MYEMMGQISQGEFRGHSSSYRSLVYPGMAPLEHIFRYHSFPSLREPK
jgi:hypothetical protein